MPPSCGGIIFPVLMIWHRGYGTFSPSLGVGSRCFLIHPSRVNSDCVSRYTESQGIILSSSFFKSKSIFWIKYTDAPVFVLYNEIRKEILSFSIWVLIGNREVLLWCYSISIPPKNFTILLQYSSINFFSPLDSGVV